MPIDTPVGRNGWRQGSILRRDDHSRIDKRLRSSLRTDARLVVVSHDCDVTSGDYNKEPLVEALVAYPVSDKKGGRKFGKNPRELEFPIRLNSSDTSYVAHASERFCIDRQLLEKITPDPQANLAVETVDNLRSWLAQRYSRSALPDEFGNRIEPIKNPMESLLDKKGSDVSAILVGIKPLGEARTDEPYEVNLYAVMPVDLYKQATLRTKAQALVDGLGKLFRGCAGIHLIDAELRAENDVTLDDMRYLRRFTNDYLSHNKPQDAVFFLDLP